MAKLLTTEYQEISRINLTYASIITYAKYTSQSQIENKTYYKLKEVHYNPDYNVDMDWYSTGLDASEKSAGYTYFNRGQTTIQEIDREITHNEDGSSPTKNVPTWWVASFGGNGETSADIIFPNIQRYAIIQNASNFNDEENPTMTFTNNQLYDLRAKLLVGSTEIISQDLQGNETSYTFELTTNQRNQLRQLCTGQTLDVTLAICSLTDNTIVYTSSTTVTMSITNATPTIVSVATETNQKVITFLGSSSASSIIANASILHFAPTITTLKYATTSALTITNNNTPYTQTTSPFELDIPIYNDNSFILNVVDSRGLSASVVDNQRTLLDYEALRINSYSFIREAPTSNNIKLNLDCVYYSTIGNISNSVAVKWKLDSGNYTTIPSTNYVIDTTNNTLKINNYELTNALSYQSTGQFTIFIEDELTTAQDSGPNGKVLKGIATFDAGEHDLQVNGDLFVADTNRENKVNILSEINSIKTNITFNTLWTNSTPTAQFNEQPITLSSNDYNYLIFLYYNINSGNFRGISSTIVPKGENALLSSMYFNDSTTVNVYMLRKATYDSDTQYSISKGWFTSTDQPGSARDYNVFIVPYKVIGIKML